MSKTIYNADYSECLPEALKKDPKMVALANATAAALLDTSGIIDNVLIYSRFDELPEELVDILAYDLHVDWYDYNYPLEAKRDLVKNSVKVHKKMGTKYAIETALGSLFPESEVEEWFQYEGEPGHFHIVLDVTNQRITADYAAIIRAVKLYKRLSAHMDELTYQGQIHGVIYTHAINLMLSKTKKLTKGGDNIGRIVIMEFKAQDSTAFDDMLAFVKQHPDFEKLEISYEPTLSLSGLEINLSRRRVINNGQEIELTVKEYDILCLLAANKGRVLTYEQIYDKVWGEISAGNEKDTVGFHIRNLRKKLCDTNSHFSIDSVREIGYRFNSQ
ncbi:phage tail protein I [Fusicatenibacter saccharivorans]|nr:phage tail protein I [Fusicatenibacter saccharivorans]MCB7101790.1 phage tail protein I [Fusicatenibacter saccharivorans]